MHTFFSVFHVLFTRVQIVYFCNPINSIFTFIPRLFGKKTIINVDGLEWKRKKWNKIGRAAHKISEYLATVLPNKVVTDSKAIRDYYRLKFDKDTEYISYGADINKTRPAGPTLKRLLLKERAYILYVSRLEPENNAHVLIEAYEKIKSDMPLIIVGDAPYGKDYINTIKSTKDPRIKFVGSIYGEGYFELLSNAFAYIHGNEVGGTNPALLEAMAFGNCIIVNGVEFNKEVVGDCGLSYEPGEPNDLKDKIEYLIKHPEYTERYRTLARERIKKYYNWDDVIGKTEELMKKLLGL